MELASVVIQPAGQLVQTALPVVLVYVPARQGYTGEGRQKKRKKNIGGGGGGGGEQCNNNPWVVTG